MPRGYLKHKSKTNGRKRSRGGSSNRSSTNGLEPKIGPTRKSGGGSSSSFATFWDDDDFVDWELMPMSSFEEEEEEEANEKNEEAEPPSTGVIGTCAICMESNLPLTQLMKNCQHDAACLSCLRQYFGTFGLQNVLDFPTTCFDPTCRLRVTDELLESKDILQTSELKRRYRLRVLNKALTKQQGVVHCPTCDHPSIGISHGFITVCRMCGNKFATMDDKNHHDCKTRNGRHFLLDESTIRVLELLLRDSKGGNDGWGQCPNCHMIVSKGDGCDHMSGIFCPCSMDRSIKQEESRIHSIVSTTLSTTLIELNACVSSSPLVRTQLVAYKYQDQPMGICKAIIYFIGCSSEMSV